MKNKTKFACFTPHPPLLLPCVGSEAQKEAVKPTIKALTMLGRQLKDSGADSIIISSPHPDWGFNVPLHFLASDFKGNIKKYLTGAEPPQFYFEKGESVFQELEPSKTYALIGSGDLSHCLKQEGPYGFHPDGPRFDKELIGALKKKDLKKILKLDELYPEAGECGLRSFCFILGILEAAAIDWQAKILSYQGPFGVGYLVANFKV